LEICQDIVSLAPDAILQSVDAGSVKVVDQPWTSGKPVSPKVKRNTIVMGLLGLLGSILVVVIVELTNNKFRSTEDVKDVLDLQVLGVIPLEDSSTKKKMKKVRRRSSSNKKGAKR
jgi:capsular polysaccharide biosynthesis protein